MIPGLEATEAPDNCFASEDKMSLHLVNLIRDRIGELFGPYVHPEFTNHEVAKTRWTRTFLSGNVNVRTWSVLY
jgi:hypothetical protein